MKSTSLRTPVLSSASEQSRTSEWSMYTIGSEALIVPLPAMRTSPQVTLLPTPFVRRSVGEWPAHLHAASSSGDRVVHEPGVSTLRHVANSSEFRAGSLARNREARQQRRARRPSRRRASIAERLTRDPARAFTEIPRPCPLQNRNAASRID